MNTRTRDQRSTRRKQINKINASTKRSQKRRKRLAEMGMKDVRIEVSTTEKELFVRVGKQLGYKGVQEYVRGENLKKAEELGMSCADIQKEWDEKAKAEQLTTTE